MWILIKYYQQNHFIAHITFFKTSQFAVNTIMDDYPVELEVFKYAFFGDFSLRLLSIELFRLILSFKYYRNAIKTLNQKQTL